MKTGKTFVTELLESEKHKLFTEHERIITSQFKSSETAENRLAQQVIKERMTSLTKAIELLNTY